MAPARASRRGRKPVKAAALVLIAMSGALALPSSSQAVGPPQIESVWSTDVAATSAGLHAEVNPEGTSTSVRFEYLSAAAYSVNLAAGKEGFAGATRAPAAGAIAIGGLSTGQLVLRQVAGLSPATTYRYRIVAISSTAPEGLASEPSFFTTQPSGAVFALPDGRGWEMVSPVDKNGGAVQGVGKNFGGDLLQAAAQGGGATYSSTSSFGPEAQGAPAASQYLAGRETSSWSTRSLTPPQRPEAEPSPAAGVPYRLFSEDLAKSLLYSGGHCTGPASGCANPSPPLAGSGAIPGYQDYYLRDDATGAYRALITAAGAPALTLTPEAFEARLAGATSDLSHVLLSTCAKLTADATETPQGEGCDPAVPNLYEWSEGSLHLVNQGLPEARLAAPLGAVSADGSRVYFTAQGGSLYLREGAQTKLVSEGGDFQTASADGSIAYYTKAGHLYLYSAVGEEITDLTPGGEVQGVLGASANGSYLYYESATGLELWHGGATTKIAAGADSVNWPPATGQARLGADGATLLFSSTEPLTGFDNTDASSGKPDAELFLYNAATKQLACVSCNPTNERPIGSATVPGAIANGEGEEATQAYRPRALSTSGQQVFFDSGDSLALQDTNKRTDVYEWEAPGAGGCEAATQVNGGCLLLISSGRDGNPSEFVDASESGGDVFFLTAASLVPTDPGSVDLYDARVGGGFSIPPSPIPCEADACQALPSEPEDPTPGTLVAGDPNPPLHYVKEGAAKAGGRHHNGKKGKGHRHPKGKKKGVRK